MENLLVLQVHCKDKRKKRRKRERGKPHVCSTSKIQLKEVEKEKIIRHYTTLPEYKERKTFPSVQE